MSIRSIVKLKRTFPNNSRVRVYRRHFPLDLSHQPSPLGKAIEVQFGSIPQAAHLPSEQDHLLLVTDSGMAISFARVTWAFLWSELLPLHCLLLQSSTLEIRQNSRINIVPAVDVHPKSQQFVPAFILHAGVVAAPLDALALHFEFSPERLLSEFALRHALKAGCGFGRFLLYGRIH